MEKTSRSEEQGRSAAEAEYNAYVEAEEIAEREARKPAWLDERVLSLAQLDIKDIPELAWIVRDLLTEGLTVFAGMLKAGKSFLITNIALAIAEGRPVLGQTEVRQGRVLYITPDDKHEARLRKRLRLMRQGRTEAIPFDIATTWTPLDKGGIEEIGEYLDYYPDTKLVVIDVLMSVLPDIKEDADAYDKIYHKLVPLKDMAQRYHVAIVLVMHMNKSTAGGNQRNRIYGSMAYGAIADNILMLDEDYNSHERFLITSGKDLEEDRFPMAFDKATGIYTYGEKRKAELQEKSESQKIGDIVKEHPGIARKDIVDIIVKSEKIEKGTADKRVTRAVEKGEICTVQGLTGYHPCSTTPPPIDPNDPDYDPD